MRRLRARRTARCCSRRRRTGFYATGFHSSAGVALISPRRAVFATDFRYFEDAESKIRGFELVMSTNERTYTDIINDFCREEGVETLAFEDDAMSYAAYRAYTEKAHGATSARGRADGASAPPQARL